MESNKQNVKKSGSLGRCALQTPPKNGPLASLIDIRFPTLNVDRHPYTIRVSIERYDQEGLTDAISSPNPIIGEAEGRLFLGVELPTRKEDILCALADKLRVSLVALHSRPPLIPDIDKPHPTALTLGLGWGEECLRQTASTQTNLRPPKRQIGA
jgi:hypothetical protein